MFECPYFLLSYWAIVVQLLPLICINNNKDVQATKLAVCARDLCTSWEVLNWEPRKLRATCVRKLLTVCARRARMKVWLIDRKAQSLLDSQVRHILASSTRMSSTGTTPCPSVGNHISCHYKRQWQLALVARTSCPPTTRYGNTRAIHVHTKWLSKYLVRSNGEHPSMYKIKWMWKPDQKSGATSESWKEKTVLAINSGCTVVIGNVPKYTLYNLIL